MRPFGLFFDGSVSSRSVRNVFINCTSNLINMSKSKAKAKSQSQSKPISLNHCAPVCSCSPVSLLSPPFSLAALLSLQNPFNVVINITSAVRKNLRVSHCAQSPAFRMWNTRALGVRVKQVRDTCFSSACKPKAVWSRHVRVTKMSQRK